MSTTESPYGLFSTLSLLKFQHQKYCNSRDKLSEWSDTSEVYVWSACHFVCTASMYLFDSNFIIALLSVRYFTDLKAVRLDCSCSLSRQNSDTLQNACWLQNRMLGELPTASQSAKVELIIISACYLLNLPLCPSLVARLTTMVLDIIGECVSLAVSQYQWTVTDFEGEAK